MREKVKLLDFPYLVRLNPNIPWKTRGNASIGIRVKSNRELEEILEIIWNKSTEYTEKISKSKKYNRKPGIAIASSHVDQWFYEKAVKDVIPLGLAYDFAQKKGIFIRGDRGIIGSIAALSYIPRNFTYELITYRPAYEWEKDTREIDFDSVIKYDELYFPNTFANVDYIKKNILIVPHGNDPILYGIRGTSILPLLDGLNIIRTTDKIEMAMLFKTNQGTDSHILQSGKYPYQTTELLGKVEKIEIKQGGDVILMLNGNIVIIYKETGELNLASKMLREGDLIKVIGAIKPSVEYGKIIEAERIEIIELNNKVLRNPRCPKCNEGTESLGKGKGFRCKKCGYKFFRDKVEVEIERELSIGIYQTRYYRHLTRPLHLETAKSEDLEIEYVNEVVEKLLSFHTL